MRVTHEMRYDAPLATVRAMLADPAFREEVVAAQHGSDSVVEVTDAGETMRVLVDQHQPAAGIPSFAKKIVGERIHIVQRETWTAADRADLEVAIPGKPGRMVGTITLAEAGGVTTQTIDAEVTVTVPLVGGKLERLVAELLGKALAAEERTGRAYLSR